MNAPASLRTGANKKCLHGLMIMIVCTIIGAQAAAAEPVTEGKFYACLSEQWLEDFTSSAVRKDHASVSDYLASDKCLMLKPNLPVTIVDEPALPDTRITFTIQGFRFYAPSEEIIRK